MVEESTIAELLKYKKSDFIPYMGGILRHCRLGEARARAYADDVASDNCYEFKGVKFGNSEWEIANFGSRWENFFEVYHMGSAMAGVAALIYRGWWPILKEGIEKLLN